MRNYCIVSYCNMYILPYVKYYVDAIRDSGAQCTLLYWDRDICEKAPELHCETIRYHRVLTKKSGTIQKVLGYIGATLFFRKIIKEKHYHGIIFLQTHAAIGCFGQLTSHKYIVDIRDWTLENYIPYRWLEQKVLRNSFLNVISSPAYKNFLPQDLNYITAHNYSCFESQKASMIRERNYRKDKGINIVYTGTIRFIENDKKLLKQFANDARFNVCYYGNGSDILRDYCQENRIFNVKFYGSFSPKKTIDFYEDADLINNLYGNHNRFLDYALSNKLYHAAQLHIPILVCPETYMEQITLQYHMGFVYDLSKTSSPDDLYKWYQHLDFKSFNEGCDIFISSVRKDNQQFANSLKSFFEQ